MLQFTLRRPPRSTPKYYIQYVYNLYVYQIIWIYITCIVVRPCDLPFPLRSQTNFFNYIPFSLRFCSQLEKNNLEHRHICEIFFRSTPQIEVFLSYSGTFCGDSYWFRGRSKMLEGYRSQRFPNLRTELLINCSPQASNLWHQGFCWPLKRSLCYKKVICYLYMFIYVHLQYSMI